MNKLNRVYLGIDKLSSAILAIFLCATVLSVNAQKTNSSVSKPRHIAIRDSLIELDYHQFSDSVQSVYWLNRIWPEREYIREVKNGKEFNEFNQFIDSAGHRAAKANCKSCFVYIDLFKVHFIETDSIIPLPPLPEKASKNLEIHWLCTVFNQNFRTQKETPLDFIERMYALVLDEEVDISQRTVVGDILATQYYYPKGEYNKALNLYQVGVKAYENKRFSKTPWIKQLELPGIYSRIMERVSRCYLNSALVLEKQGHFGEAVTSLVTGADLYARLGDTLGLLWAYRDLSNTYAAQQDYDNVLRYIDSTLSIIDKGSKSLFESKTRAYSETLESHINLAFNEQVGDRLFSLIKGRFFAEREGIPEKETNAGMYYAFLKLNLIALDNYWNNTSIPIDELDTLIDPLNELDYSGYVYEDNIKNQIHFQYWLLKAYQNKDSKDFSLYQRKYRSFSEKIHVLSNKQAQYDFARYFLMEIEDFDFLLKLNHDLPSIAGSVSRSMLNLAKDQYLAWEAIGRYDSALHYHKYYFQVKDSLANRQNYMDLARADLKLKMVNDLRQTQILKAENRLHKQRALILVIVSIASISIALLYRQRRRRDKTLNERTAELLKVKAESESFKNIELLNKNIELEQELRASIVLAMQNQNRNLELVEMVEDLKSASVDSNVGRRTSEIKRKLSDNMLEEILYDIEMQAIKVYPKLHSYLQEKLSSRNKIELLLCITLVMNYSTDDISRLLQRSEKAVRSLRYRIRKRLELDENQDLLKHLREYI